jgi:hypothetical protein
MIGLDLELSRFTWRRKTVRPSELKGDWNGIWRMHHLSSREASCLQGILSDHACYSADLCWSSNRTYFWWKHAENVRNLEERLGWKCSFVQLVLDKTYMNFIKFPWQLVLDIKYAVPHFNPCYTSWINKTESKLKYTISHPLRLQYAAMLYLYYILSTHLSISHTYTILYNPIDIYTSKYLWNIYYKWNIHDIFVKYVFLSQTCSRNSVPPGQVGPRGPHGSLPGWVCPVAPQEGWHIDSDRFKQKKWTFLKCVWVCLGCLMHALHMFWIVVLIIRLFIMYVYMCLWSMSFTAIWQSDMFGKCFLPYLTIIIPNHFQSFPTAKVINIFQFFCPSHRFVLQPFPMGSVGKDPPWSEQRCREGHRAGASDSPSKSIVSSHDRPANMSCIIIICACIYIYVYACMYVCMHACMYVCKYVSKYVSKYVCMSGCLSVCLAGCMSVCMYVCK